MSNALGGISDEMTTLFRPVGQKELVLIQDSGFREFPPRLQEQPIFYPVLNEEYAIQIARDWNTKSGARPGFVTRFQVRAKFLERYEIKTVALQFTRNIGFRLRICLNSTETLSD